MVRCQHPKSTLIPCNCKTQPERGYGIQSHLKIDKEKFYKKLFKNQKRTSPKFQNIQKQSHMPGKDVSSYCEIKKNFFLLKIICLASKELISDKNKDFV